MQITLHIGQSKTGTSAIQSFLTLSRRQLERVGVLYPMVSIGGTLLELGCHNALADALAGVQTYPYLMPSEYFDAFFKEAERLGTRHMILSGEHFFGGQPRLWDVGSEDEFDDIYRNKIANLAKFLRGHDVELIVYLRPQDAWFASTVSQTVHIERLVAPTRIYDSDRQFFEMVRVSLLYSEILDRWKEELRPRRFTVVAYVRDQLRGGSSVTDFLHRIGLADLAARATLTNRTINRSLTRSYVEVKKILNTASRSELDERVVIHCLRNLSCRSSEGTDYVVDPEVLDDLRKYVAVSNQRLSQEYLDRSYSFALEPSGREPARPPTEAAVQQAMLQFQREYRRMPTRLLRLDYRMRAYLRENVGRLHGVLHRARKLQWRLLRD